MFNFLSLSKYNYEYMKGVKQDLHYTMDKRQQRIDLIVSFLIIVVMFSLVGFLFNQLSNIRYLFYMMLIATVCSSFVAYYIQEMTFLKNQKLLKYFMSGFSREMIVLLIIVVLSGLSLIHLIYAPFFNIVDTIILLVILVISTSILVYYDYDYRLRFNEVFSIVYHAVLITIVSITTIYVLPELPVHLVFLLPIILVLLGYLIRVTVVSKIYVTQSLFLSLHLNVLTVMILFMIIYSRQTWYFNGNEVQTHTLSHSLFTFVLDKHEVCDLTDDIDSGFGLSSSALHLVDENFVVQTGDSISVYDFNCNPISSIDTSTGVHIVYASGNQLHALIEVDPEEVLEPYYNAYDFYIYDEGEFEHQRTLYQYGYANELFLYQDQWAYKMPSYYAPNDDSSEHYFQVFNEFSNYGEDVQITEDKTHYKDDVKLIYGPAVSVVQSHVNSGQSWLYSSDYILTFDTVAQTLQIESLASFRNHQNSYLVDVEKNQIGLSSNLVTDFDVVDKLFYFYGQGNFMVYSDENEQVAFVENFPSTFVVDHQQVYILEEGILSSVSLDNLGSYHMIPHYYLGSQTLLEWELDIGALDTPVIIHTTSILWNVGFLMVLITITVIPIASKKHLD